MSAGGRPKSDNPKSVKIGWRVTESERDRLIEYCERKNLMQSQVFQEALELLYKTKP